MTTRLERNVGRYLWFNAVSILPFTLPVIVLFWQENGLDLFDAFLLQAIFAVAIVVLEVPTGMVADRVGKRASLLLGMAINVVGWVVYASGAGFGAFLIAELLLALGVSFYSGAGSALLYDTLKELGREEEFRKYEGKARALQMVTIAGSNLLGGWIGSYSLRATVWLSALGPLAGLVLAFSLVEALSERADAPAARATSYGALVSDSWRFVRKHRLVRWQIAFFAVVMGSITWLLWLYQPYMAWSGLPVWAFGIAFTIFNLFAAGASHLAHAVDARCGRVLTLVLLCVLMLLPLVGMAVWVTPLSFLFILGHQAVRGMVMPIIADRILRYTYADKRATILSISTMASRLFFAATGPVIGLLSKHTTMATTLLGQAAALVLLLGGLMVAYVRIPPKYFEVKASVRERQ